MIAPVFGEDEHFLNKERMALNKLPVPKTWRIYWRRVTERTSIETSSKWVLAVFWFAVMVF